MNFKPTLRTLLLALAIACTSFLAQAQTLPNGIKKVTSVEGITEYQLQNGLRVLLFPDQSKPKITVNITYLVGSRFEGYGETGMAHLLEHMVFKGTPKHKNIPAELTEHGASPNGTTWYDRTNYFESFSATDENLEWALDLEADRMINSFIAKKDLETEMTVVRNEFEMGENDPGGILYERVLSTAFLWHNYGKSTIGARSDIEDVPIERLQAFYHKYYQPDNAVLLVAGKIDPAKTLKLIDKFFSPIPKPERKVPLYPTYTREPTQDGERHVTLKRVGDLQVTSCAYHIPSGTHPDFAPVQILEDILTNEPSGRLYKAMVESEKSTGVWGHAPALREPGYLYINADVRASKDLKDAQKTMLDILDNITAKPPTKEEVDRAKQRILKHWNLNFNDANRIGIYMSSYIAQGDWRLLFLYRDAIEKVTPDDVYNVAKKYLKPSNRTVGAFIPTQHPDRAIIPEAPDVAELVKNYKGRKEVAKGEAFDPSPANIQNRTHTVTLKSGAKIALLKKENRGNAVTARMRFRFGNLKSLSGKATAAELAADMLNKGTKSMTRQQIQDKFDALKARVSFWGGYYGLTVNIETENENLDKTIQLVFDILKNPAFPKDEFDKLIQEDLADIESQQSDPQAIASLELEKHTTPKYDKNDPRYVSDFKEDIDAYKKVTLQEVKDFYKNFYGASNATVAVVGDFDESKIKNTLSGELSNWKSPTKYKRIKSEFYDAPAVNKNINTPDKSNALFLVQQNLKLNQDDPDYAALTLGNFILGGGFLNSRLATRIRQKEGLSYGVGSWLYGSSLDKAGAFGSYAIYAPENVKKLEKAYNEEIQKMLTEGFTDEEVEAAKSGYLQSQVVSRSSDRTLSRSLESNLFINREMKWSARFEDKIKNLTTAQINAAMKRHVNPKKFVMIKAGDFEKNNTKP